MADTRRSAALAFILVALASPRRAWADEPLAPATTDAPDDTALLDEDLSIEELLEGNIVVRTATSTDQKQSEAPAIITAIPRSTLEAFGYKTVGEALASVPGLYVVDDLVTQNVAVRGVWGGPDSWSRIVKFLIDGHPATFNSTGGAFVGPEFIPIDAVEAIEVIRGPASALYGANAFLGVVNVITRQPGKDPIVRGGFEGVLVRDRPGWTGDVTGSVRSDDGHASLFVAASTGRIDRSGLTAPRSSPSYAAFAGRQSTSDLSRPVSVFAKGSWGGRGLGTVTASLIYQRLDAHGEWTSYSILSPATRFVQENRILNAEHAIDFFHGQLSVNSHASFVEGDYLAPDLVDADIPYLRFHRDRSNRSISAGSEVHFAHRQFSLVGGVDFQWDHDSGDTVHAITVGNTGVAKDGSSVIQAFGTALDVFDMGPYIQGVLRPIEHLGLTANLRYDINDHWGNALNGRAAATYELTRDLSVKLLFGTSFVPPAPTQVSEVSLRSDGGLRGNPNLKSQTAETWEAGVTYNLADAISLSGSTFFTQIHDRIEDVQQGLGVVPLNFNSSSTIGGELSADARYRMLFAKADVSLEKTTVQDPAIAPFWFTAAFSDDPATGRDSPVFPTWMGHLRLGGAFAALHVEPTLSLAVVGPRKSSMANILVEKHAYFLDPYVTLDANVRTLGLHLIEDRATDIVLHATNLTGTQYANGGALGVDIPAVGRTVSLRLSQEF